MNALTVVGACTASNSILTLPQLVSSVTPYVRVPSRTSFCSGGAGYCLASGCAAGASVQSIGAAVGVADGVGDVEVSGVAVTASSPRETPHHTAPGHDHDRRGDDRGELGALAALGLVGGAARLLALVALPGELALAVLAGHVGPLRWCTCGAWVLRVVRRPCPRCPQMSSAMLPRRGQTAHPRSPGRRPRRQVRCGPAVVGTLGGRSRIPQPRPPALERPGARRRLPRRGLRDQLLRPGPRAGRGVRRRRPRRRGGWRPGPGAGRAPAAPGGRAAHPRPPRPHLLGDAGLPGRGHPGLDPPRRRGAAGRPDAGRCRRTPARSSAAACSGPSRTTSAPWPTARCSSWPGCRSPSTTPRATPRAR